MKDHKCGDPNASCDVDCTAERQDCYEYVRRYYRVPAYVGGRVKVFGKTGTIVETREALHYVHIQLDGEDLVYRYHPASTDLEYIRESARKADHEL